MLDLSVYLTEYETFDYSRDKVNLVCSLVLYLDASILFYSALFFLCLVSVHHLFNLLSF